MGEDYIPSYQRWINNPPGYAVGEPLSRGLFGLDSNGAWLESGDYDRAFRGFPSPKTINIFAGGFAQAPSTKSIIFGGLANFGVKALGIWFLSKLSRPAQASTTLQSKFPLSDYFSNINLKMNWGDTGSTGGGSTATRSTGTDPDKGKNDKVDNKDKGNPVDEPDKDKKDVEDANPINGNDPKVETSKIGIATNKKLGTIPIKGEVTNIDYASDGGYPTKFDILDRTFYENDSDKNKVHTYRFELEGGQPKDGEKPKYKLTEFDFNGKVIATGNTYTVSEGFTLNNESKKQEVTSEIKMDSQGQKASVSRATQDTTVPDSVNKNKFETEHYTTKNP